MLTIFTIPKPFKDHIATIQRNALQSWTILRPKCEIILCGDAPGIEETAIEFGVKHLRDISQNEFGTPLLNSAFSKVAKIAQFPLMCYVNADIIFLNDILYAIKRIPFRPFVAVGRRTNIALTEEWDFEKPNWRSQLLKFVAKNGQLANGAWIDYFVFTPNGHLEELLPFAVGRPEWDNWFIYHARKLNVAIVDITRVNRVIHQSHDYSHVPMGTSVSWWGPEADYNHRYYINSVGHSGYLCNIWDATHILTRFFLLPSLGPRYLRQHLYTEAVLHPSLKPLAEVLRPLLFAPNWIKDRLRKK